MESTGEVETVEVCKTDIKDESMLTDPDCQPLEEVEQIFIKEENLKLEIPDDNAVDPLQLEKEMVTDPDYQPFEVEQIFIKEEHLELENEVESTGCNSEAVSLKRKSTRTTRRQQQYAVRADQWYHYKTQNPDVTAENSSPRIIPSDVEDDKSTACSGDVATRGGLATAMTNTMQFPTKQAISSNHKSGINHRIHSCPISKKTFLHLQDSNKENHMENCIFTYYCTLCQNTFTTSSYLKIHPSLHHDDRPYNCDVCHKTFLKKSHLKSHSLLHTVEFPFICEVCNKVFRYQSSLTRHSRWHRDERPYNCDVCHKKCLTSGSLKLHSRVHTGERPYKCEVCNKSFRSSSCLKCHLRVHIGVPPFTCATCLKTSKEKFPLKFPLDCNFCYRKFTFPSSLTNHLLRHTGEPPVKCCVCSKTFTASSIMAQTFQLSQANALSVVHVV